jgi:hypothetical protein
MHHLRTPLCPSAVWLGRHLTRLRRTLGGLSQRLRESLAVALGQSVEGAVREAVQALLAEAPTHPSEVPSWRRSRTSPGLRFDDPDEAAVHAPWPDPSLPEDLDEDEPTTTLAQPRAPTRSARWRNVLTASLQATTWWLQRPARPRLRTALGMGMLVALLVWASGPLVGTARLAVSALALACLPDTIDLASEASSLVSLLRQLPHSLGPRPGSPAREPPVPDFVVGTRESERREKKTLRGGKVLRGETRSDTRPRTKR